MKERNGFVSNSSSSSFVVYGVILTKNQKKKLQEKFDPENVEDSCLAELIITNSELDSHQQEYGEDDIIVGKEICSTYNESFEEIEFLTDKEKEEVENKLIQIGINTKPKYYIGGLSG